MIYKETEAQMGQYWHSFCKDNLSAKYPQWYPATQILGVSPAQLVKILIEDYHAIVQYPQNRTGPDPTFFVKRWESQTDMRKWKNFINKKAREAQYEI